MIGFLRPSRLIAFSGMDGSGKSTQVALLREHLEARGWETAVVWTRLEWTTLWESGKLLDRIAAPLNWLLGRARPATEQAAPRVGAAALFSPGPATTAAARLRRRSALLTHAWVFVIAAVHAGRQRQAVRTASAPGRVVICDRYSLDAAVGLRRRYGERHSFALQVRVLELLSPRPLVAWHLDVPPSLAKTRRDEGFSDEDLDRLVTLYGEERKRLGWRRLDATRSAPELARDVARTSEGALRPRAPRDPAGRHRVRDLFSRLRRPKRHMRR
jgi:thymidylate kinase